MPSSPDPGSTRRATIRDVAARAGVGTMTVSRVVTGRGYVSRETRERVEEAIAVLGYLPNQQARGLRSNRSGTLALMVSDITNPYFTTLARGVEDTARPNGLLMLMTSSDESEEEELRYMRLLVQKGVDGVILVPSHAGTAALHLARERGIPCVVADRRGPPEFDCVRCDSVAGSAEVARHLLEAGHRRAAILAAEPGISTSDDRVAGFSAAFAAGGGESEAYRGRFRVEDGQMLTERILTLAPPPTCLFAVNNFLAIGALKALHEAGIGVPHGMSVVGYDDLPASILAFPFLSVVNQPAREMGVLACTLLLERMANPGAPIQERILPTAWVQRMSVGAPG